MTNGKFYGNNSMGFGYSPDRSHNVSHDNLRSQFLNASGSRQGGYYYSPSYSTCSTYSSKPKGRYLSNGQYVED